MNDLRLNKAKLEELETLVAFVSPNKLSRIITELHLRFISSCGDCLPQDFTTNTVDLCFLMKFLEKLDDLDKGTLPNSEFINPN